MRERERMGILGLPKFGREYGAQFSSQRPFSGTPGMGLIDNAQGLGSAPARP